MEVAFSYLYKEGLRVRHSNPHGRNISRLGRCPFGSFMMHRSLHMFQHLTLGLRFQCDNHVTWGRNTLRGRGMLGEVGLAWLRREHTGGRSWTSWIAYSLTCFSRLALSGCLLSSSVSLPFILSIMFIASFAKGEV